MPWVRRFVPALLVACLVVIGWQYFCWWRVSNYWARQYAGGLINSVIGFDRLKGVADPGERSIKMVWVYGVGQGSLTTGDVLDVMTQRGAPTRVGILGRALVELRPFSRDLWAQRGLNPPVAGSKQNAVPPQADLDRLEQVWTIYRDSFSEAVVRSGSYERQRRALLDAHQRLQAQGLTNLLSRPEVLGQGL